MSDTNPPTLDNELDKMFNKTINAKQIAVDTFLANSEMSAFMDNAEIAKEADIFLQRYRQEFKQAIKSLILEERIDELQSLNWDIIGYNKEQIKNTISQHIKELKAKEK